jgi:hypothetical protein
VTVTQKAIRDLPQPINLSIADNNAPRSVIQNNNQETSKPPPRWLIDTLGEQDNCAARLISMAAARAQQQQQNAFTITSSPVKEATEALMLLQETV